jgi:outer membrane protein TolC
MVGLAFEVPLQVGRRRAALEEARARLEAARSERAAVEAEVRLAVRSAAERVEEARRVLAVVQDRLLPAARDQLDAARAAFETGQESFLAVIEAERDLREVELGEHEALADLDRRVAELESATGTLPGLR